MTQADHLHLVGDVAGDAELEAIRRSTDLHQLEGIVRRGLRPALEVAAAVLRIHDAGLYKLTHTTWASYCRTLDLSPSRAYQLMGFARVSTNVEEPVPNEAVARELDRAPPEAQQQLFAQAVAAAGGAAPTGELTRAIVDQALGVERQADGKVKAPRLQVRRTPRWLFDELNERFGPFRLDAYASPENALCEAYLTEEQDGHVTDWIDVTFANPEFEDMALCLQQAVRMAERHIRSLVVGPVPCSQSWCHELAIYGTEWRPDRRISYDLPDGTPTKEADRDTTIFTFGGPSQNPYRRKGQFLVQRLELRGPQA